MLTTNPSFLPDPSVGRLEGMMTTMQGQLSLQFEQLMQRLGTMQDQLVNLQTQLGSQQQRIQTLEGDKAALQGRVTKLEQQLSNSYASYQGLSARIEQLEQRQPSQAAPVRGITIPTSSSDSPDPRYANMFRFPVELLPNVDSEATGRTLREQIEADVAKLLKNHKQGPLQVEICEARLVNPKPRLGSDGAVLAPAGPPFYVVKTLESDASELRKARPQLKGRGLSIQDWLSPEEWKIRRAFARQFDEARKQGLKPTFRRAQLFIHGEPVALSPAASAPSAAPAPKAAAVAAA